MDSATLLNLFGATALLTLKLCAPVLAAGLVVGLVVSLFQALTQINESTLSFLPKLVVMALVAWFTLPWMVREMVEFTAHVCALAAGASR